MTQQEFIAIYGEQEVSFFSLCRGTLTFVGDYNTGTLTVFLQYTEDLNIYYREKYLIKNLPFISAGFVNEGGVAIDLCKQPAETPTLSELIREQTLSQELPIFSDEEFLPKEQIHNLFLKQRRSTL